MSTWYEVDKTTKNFVGVLEVREEGTEELLVGASGQGNRHLLELCRTPWTPWILVVVAAKPHPAFVK